MSLFKRKQSKDKEGATGAVPVSGPLAEHQSPINTSSPPVTYTATMTRPRKSSSAFNSTTPQMNGPRIGGGPSQVGNGSQVGIGQASSGGSYGSPNGPNINGPQMVNGRRMTSNPAQMQPGQPGNIQYPINPAYQGDNGNPAAGPAYQAGHSSSSTNLNNQASTPNRQSTVPNTSYPWATRPLKLYPAQTSPPSAPQSPFPRYGLSVPAFPSHSGHMLLFGGLVHESVKNDLWSMDVRDCTTMPVKTKGDAPVPRVGHASAIADRIMLIWGGDTKVKQDDSQDESLYILDLRTQEWTNVPVTPGPIGRYGHAAAMHDTRFFVFGGQAEGSFMNDLWAYDIKQLSSEKQHVWEQINYTTPAPPKRTGHVLIAHQGKLYLFGGTDGMYHYNDTWSFDIATGAWTELSCIGYIPVPREGHAAAVVDDVMYIFGGRDVNGKDLGDLAAFRITNQRWYMFQNMGPAPTARSGHAMVAAHGKIFVVGGEANASSPQVKDDPTLMHVLDTSKIKYPPDNQPPRQVKPRVSDWPNQQAQPVKASDTPQSVKKALAPSASMDSLARAASPPVSSDRLNELAQSPPMQMQPMAPLAPLAPPINPSVVSRSESQDVQQGQQQQRNGPPQRPRREGDDEFRRAMSPPNAGGPTSPGSNGFPVRVTSPTGGPSSPPQMPGKSGFNPSVLGTRSPSPRMRMAEANGDRPAPPPDAFYYGRSPTTANGFPNGGRPGSVSGSADLIRELKGKEAEVEAGRKREAALRVIIGRATQQGFTYDALDNESEDGSKQDAEEIGGDAETVRKLADALVRLKQDKAAIQNELVSQIRAASDRAAEAERLRKGALQEAAFYRAKVATLESNSPLDLARIEKERISELERQLASLHQNHTMAQKELEKLSGQNSGSRDLHTDSVQRENETLKRAEDAEDAHRLAIEEMEELQQRVKLAENSLREHGERLISTQSLAQQREAENDRLRSQLEEAITTRDDHLSVIDQVQKAVLAAGVRSTEIEDMYNRSQQKILELEEELTENRAELEARGRESEVIQTRMRDVENAYAKSREEADSLRNVTTSRLGELLASHRSIKEDESRLTRGHGDQVRALEEESNSLRKMLKEAGQRLDAAESGFMGHRAKTRDLELSHHGLKAEMRGIRGKLTSAQQELSKWKQLYESKDDELREREAALTEIETRCSTLRNLLADHGIAVNESDLANPSDSSSSSREMESRLRDKTREADNAQREIEALNRRCSEAEDKVESLGRLVERMKDARSPTAMSMRSPSPTRAGEGDRRVLDAERKMVELETQHKEKMAALEGDYQTAVRYVKGTEKMLKRMKDELNKQKSANSSLQAEIDGLTGRSSTEPGARTREIVSGRATPSGMETEFNRRFDKLQQQHNALQAELQASRDVLSAREREVEVMRMRCEEAEREVEVLREDLHQAQQRINTLLEMGGDGNGTFLASEDEDGRRGSMGSSEEASMSFDKFSKEFNKWERSRSPPNGSNHLESDDDDTARLGRVVGQNEGKKAANGQKSHQRHSSEYSGDWVQ